MCIQIVVWIIIILNEIDNQNKTRKLIFKTIKDHFMLVDI